MASVTDIHSAVVSFNYQCGATELADFVKMNGPHHHRCPKCWRQFICAAAAGSVTPTQADVARLLKIVERTGLA